MGQLNEYALTTRNANNQSRFYSSVYPQDNPASKGSGDKGPYQKTELTKAGVGEKPSGMGNKPDLQKRDRRKMFNINFKNIS